MIKLKNVTKQYRKTSVLKDITLDIEKPGIYCLLGRNGAGKTTLLKSLAGYQNITSGEISIDDKTISTATLDTGVSYIETFEKHFNLPIYKLLDLAAKINPFYDYALALEMIEDFELDEHKKFNKLSLGMKTMVSTIILLASNKDIILLDEPVLGFDIIMRKRFYDMLTKSFERHRRIIIVSTHIIDEISKTIQKLIILDKGEILFFDTLKSIQEKAFSISGKKSDVDNITQNLNVIGQDIIGGIATSYIFDNPPKAKPCIEIQLLSLQDFFIQIVSHNKGERK